MTLDTLLNIAFSLKSIERLDDRQMIIHVDDRERKYKDMQTLNVDDGATLQLVGYKGDVCRLLYTRRNEMDLEYATRD